MIGTNSLNVAAILVFGCRFAIGMAGLHWWFHGDELQLGIAGGALALTVLPGLLFRDPLLRDATSAVTAVLLAAHIVFGMLGSLYETSALYDKVMHVLGSGAVAGLLMLATHRYCSRHIIELPLVLIFAIVLGGTLSAGTLWELFEFAIDSTGMVNAQRGLTDTMLDLLADTGGAVMMIATLATVSLISTPST